MATFYPVKTRQILDASVDLLALGGLSGWTVEGVATRARCAKGLVLYHYRTKRLLLEATADSLAARAASERLRAAKGDEATVLDRLWTALVEEVESGRFPGRIGLLAIGLPGSLHQGLRDQLANSLGIEPASLGSEKAIEAVLDGLSLQLLAGAGADQVRDCYDRLWLGLIAP